MELLQLQYFVEVAKQKSVTRAAELLQVSQPSLSQTIHRLERELGAKLIEKQGRGIQLTAAGRRFYTQITLALNSIRYAAEDVHRDRLQGNITLGTYMPVSVLLPCIQAFSRENPDVTFTILSMTDSHILQSELMDGILGYNMSNTMGFRERMRLGSVPSIQIVPIDHAPPANGSSYTLSDLQKDVFVSLVLPGQHDEEIFSEFARVGIAPDIRYRTNSSLIKQELLEAGLACGFSNEILGALYRKTGKYRVHHYSRGSYRPDIILTWRSNEVLSLAAQQFKAFCGQWFRTAGTKTK